MLNALQKRVPHNMETKKLLFGYIWAWNANEASEDDKRVPKVDTRKWRIRGSEAPEVFAELRALLRESGAHVADLAQIFDEDAGGELSVDEIEFVKVKSSRVALAPP